LYRIQQISLRSRSLFSELTFPLFRPLLSAADTDSRYVFLGVALLNQPVALGIAEIDQEDKTQGDVLSICVAMQYRRNGLGTRLLKLMEETMADRGVHLGRFTYMSGLPQTPAVEAMLRRSGWLEPRYRMMICDVEFDGISKAPWMQCRSLPPEFATFPWSDLTNAERQDILDRQAKQHWYPEELTPFRNEHLIEPAMSLGLRYRDEAVGWCIAHRLSMETVRYASLFVRRDLQAMGRAVQLLAKSIYLCVGTPIYKGRFDVAMDNPAMLRFVKTRMAPYLASIRYVLRSHKRLQALQELETRSA
jgi:GNAT superfamily N-acetyltransferase